MKKQSNPLPPNMRHERPKPKPLSELGGICNIPSKPTPPPPPPPTGRLMKDSELTNSKKEQEATFYWKSKPSYELSTKELHAIILWQINERKKTEERHKQNLEFFKLAAGVKK